MLLLHRNVLILNHVQIVSYDIYFDYSNAKVTQYITVSSFVLCVRLLTSLFPREAVSPGKRCYFSRDVSFSQATGRLNFLLSWPYSKGWLILS